MNRLFKPFAITASTPGHPRKLFTPIVVANLDTDNGPIAAEVNAMWDTGAEICIMSRRLAEALEIAISKPIEAAGCFATSTAFLGEASVSLVANGLIIETKTAIIEAASPTNEYSFIIGLNFIRQGTLAISSTPLSTTLSFTIADNSVIAYIIHSVVPERVAGPAPPMLS